MPVLAQLYIILSMLVFFFLIAVGSTFESAILKSAIFFSALVIITKLSSFMLDIIKNKPGKKTETKSSSQ